MRFPVAALAALLLLLGPRAAETAGQWSSYARPYTYRALLTEGDTVWCATLEAGLLRFVDGPLGGWSGFHRAPGELTSNRLTALALESNGRLWVGTDGAGVSRLSADRSSWDLVSAFDGLPSDSITALVRQGDSIWIGTARGLALWNGREIAGAIPNGFDPSPFDNDRVTGIVPRGDSLWISTLGGIYSSRVSTGFQTWSRDTAGLFSPTILGLARSGTSLLAYGSEAVYLWNDATSRWGTVGSVANIGRVLAFTGQRDRVIASSHVGIWRWVSGSSWTQVGGFASAPGDPRRISIVGVAEDDSLWFAQMEGLRKQGTGLFDWPLFVPDAPVGNDVINLALQGTKVYACTFAEGVARFDGAKIWRNWYATTCSGTCDSTFASSFFTFGLLVDTRGHKWVGAWAGALEEIDDSVSPPLFVHHYVDEPVAESRQRHSFVFATENDPDGGRWFGLVTNGITEPIIPLGLDYYDSNGVYRRSFRPESTAFMRGNEIRAMLLDRENGRMFVGYSGGSKGLDYFDFATFRTDGVPDFQRVDDPAALEVIGLAVYGDSLWVLTTSDLRRYSASGFTLHQILAKPGAAAENSLHPIDVGPDGTVWLGTENGLRAIRAGNVTQDFTVANSPLLDNRVKAVRVDPVTGVVWIGTGGGVNRYDPAYVPPAETPPDQLQVTLLPNPVLLTALGASFRLRGNATRYDVEVLDVNGRRVRRFHGVDNGRAFWDGRDQSNRLVRPGLYFVRITAGGLTATRRITLLR